jgi:hypothetical protein
LANVAFLAHGTFNSRPTSDRQGFRPVYERKILLRYDAGHFAEPTMTQQVVFGRRAKTFVVSSSLLPADALMLSLQAEGFETDLVVDNGSGQAFKEWQRARQAGRVVAWVMTFILLTPGILCFVFKAPNSVSGSVELVGMVANFWLRRSRRRHLKEIASWES